MKTARHLILILTLLTAAPVSATDYYAVLWDPAAPAITTGRNSAAGTVVGYSTGDWPTPGNVATVGNLDQLMAVIEGDSSVPHRLFLWQGTFDDAGDYLLIDAVNTQSLSVIGQGDNTILDGSSIVQPYAVLADGRSGLTFERFKISGGSLAFKFVDAGFDELVRNPAGNTIDNVTMENQSNFGVRVVCAWDSFTNFVLKNSTISDDNKDAIGVHFTTLADCNINDIDIVDNHITGVERGIEFFSRQEDAGLNDSSPYDILIDGNTVTDTHHYGIVFQSGLKAGTGTTSYVRNNYLENIGESTSAHVNGIQLSWCRDLIVENNVVINVNTSQPDGHAIIADWAWFSSNYVSEGIIIRNNVTHGSKALNCVSSFAGGIVVYKARNTIVHHNVSYDNCVGFKLTRGFATGTVFYNNTAYANLIANGRADIGAPASVWKNNIFDGRGITPYGVTTANSGTVFPTMSNNIFFNHTVADKYDGLTATTVPLGSGSMTVAPLLQNGHELMQGSPAIDAADASVLSDLPEAVAINGVVIKTPSGEHFPYGAGGLDIGAFEYIVDSDADGVEDALDNCIVVPNGPLLTDDGGTQVDTNGDGFGNLCDQDLNNDLAINFIDFELFKPAFLSTPTDPGWNPDADFDNDGAINFVDAAMLREVFFGVPGPSGIAGSSGR